jgi:hypothetical protein
MTRTNVTLPFTAYPKQLPYVQSTAMFKLGGGARGGGKSHTLAGMAVLLSFLYPGNTGVIGRDLLTNFRKTTLPLLLELIPPELLIRHEQGRDFYIDILSADGKTPSRIWYIEMLSPGNVLSGNFGWFGIDQAEQVPLETFINLGGTLRGPLPGGRPRPLHGLLTANPQAGWLMETFPVLEEEQALFDAAVAKEGPNFRPFESPYTRGKMIDADYAYFPFRAIDNPANGPGYEARLIREYGKLGASWVARMVYGVWNATREGLVYELAEANLWRRPKPGTQLYRQSAPVELGIDPSNGAGVYAVVVIQRWRDYVLVVDEYAVKGGTDESFHAWAKTRPWYNDVNDGLADSAKPDTIGRLRAWGLPIRAIPKKKNVSDQINAVKGGMAVNPVTGQPQLVIDEAACPTLVNEMRRRLYKRPNPKNPDMNVPEQPVKAWDNCCNALEYWYYTKLPFGLEGEGYPQQPLYEARKYMTLVR